ncbi:MAG TPA: DUF3263 domain-containing protein [Acidimicrobiia bacterium]
MFDEMDRTVLDYERAWANQTGPKDLSIEMDLGLTAEAYYTRLRNLITDSRVTTYDPMTVLRLRRIIETPDPAEAVG